MALKEKLSVFREIFHKKFFYYKDKLTNTEDSECGGNSSSAGKVSVG